MSIPVTCQCGNRFDVPEEYAGKKGKCPGCGQLLVVPPAGSTQPERKQVDLPVPNLSDQKPRRSLQGFRNARSRLTGSSGRHKRWICLVAAVLCLAGSVAALVILLVFPWASSVSRLVGQLKGGTKAEKMQALAMLAKVGPSACEAIPEIDEIANDKRDADLSRRAMAARQIVDPFHQSMSGMEYFSLMVDPDPCSEGIVSIIEEVDDPEVKANALAALGRFLIAPVGDTGLIKVIITDPAYQGTVRVLESHLTDADVRVRRGAAMGLWYVSLRRENIPAFQIAENSLKGTVSNDSDQICRGLAKMALGSGGQTDVDTRAAARECQRELRESTATYLKRWLQILLGISIGALLPTGLWTLRSFFRAPATRTSASVLPNL